MTATQAATADGIEPVAATTGSGIGPVDDPFRQRLLDGLAQNITERGYRETTIADIVRQARTSRRTFYEHFADKESCFLALYSQTSDDLLTLIAGAAGGEGAWQARLEAAARTYFGALAAEPALIRASMLEIRAAGPRARELRRDVQGRYAGLLTMLSEAAASDDPTVRPLTPALATAVIGGLDELLWSFAPDGARPAPRTLADVPAVTPESTAMAKELKRRGFRFVGPTTAYALMQGTGMVNDHLADCTAR